jgi:hypothetical protein
MQKYDSAAPRGINESILAAHARLIAFVWVSVGRCESDGLGRATDVGVDNLGGDRNDVSGSCLELLLSVLVVAGVPIKAPPDPGVRV